MASFSSVADKRYNPTAAQPVAIRAQLLSGSKSSRNGEAYDALRDCLNGLEALVTAPIQLQYRSPRQASDEFVERQSTA